MACPLQRDVVLGKRERLPAGHEELESHEVEARDHLGHRVLHLQTGVHLQEVKLPVLVDELDGPGVHVPAGAGEPDGGFPHGGGDRRAGRSGAGASSTSFW